ncbi:hypothetical protein B0H16DRAFT_1484648 [Mycena metata]|uniref:Uncharacterized protein n=1 Tax=Mycena metata TaxID=1033252 RepID=A0AAD7DRC0_9AGAR|nr:hypothetical protein B0H16DRAFT_1484648 [Mycena metata]
MSPVAVAFPCYSAVCAHIHPTTPAANTHGCIPAPPRPLGILPSSTHRKQEQPPLHSADPPPPIYFVPSPLPLILRRRNAALQRHVPGPNQAHSAQHRRRTTLTQQQNELRPFRTVRIHPCARTQLVLLHDFAHVARRQ